MAINHNLRFARPNRNRFSDSFSLDRRVWVNPIDQQEFSVSHLSPSFMRIRYVKNGEQREVNARVTYSHHCYTREMTPMDDERLHVVTEFYRQREKRRMFDDQRWSYSHALPELMSKIQNMPCKRDADNQVVIHFASRDANYPQIGWYTFIRIQVDPRYPDVLQLEVRTTHRRNSDPSTIPYPIRFSQHLASLLND